MACQPGSNLPRRLTSEPTTFDASINSLLATCRPLGHQVQMKYKFKSFCHSIYDAVDTKHMLLLEQCGDKTYIVLPHSWTVNTIPRL